MLLVLAVLDSGHHGFALGPSVDDESLEALCPAIDLRGRRNANASAFDKDGVLEGLGAKTRPRLGTLFILAILIPMIVLVDVLAAAFHIGVPDDELDAGVVRKNILNNAAFDVDENSLLTHSLVSFADLGASLISH
jgi:hypothetical protein